MTRPQLAKLKQSELRRAETKQEKKSRHKRFQAKRGKYTTKRLRESANKQTFADAKLIDQDKLPQYKDKLKHGELTEYIWEWQGEHALQTAQDFLLLAKDALPPDSLGYLAMGNGRGKNSNWIGTRMGSPREVWRHSQTFLSSKSSNTHEILQTATYSTDAVHLFVEVKMTTKGEVNVWKPKGNRRKKK